MSDKIMLAVFCALIKTNVVYSFEPEYNFITEHPVILFWNTSLLNYVNFTTTRYSRKDPIYYVNINVDTKCTIDSSTTSIHFVFYEFLSNEYRRSFVEMHLKWCAFIYNDLFMGSQLKANLPPKCPHPPGKYNLVNMTVASRVIPKGFPFTKGRIFCNVTYYDGLLVSGYIDMELKQKKKRTKL